MRRNHKPMNQCDGQLWQIYIAWADSFRVNLCWATSWRGHFFSKGSVTEFEKCCVLLFVFTCSEMNVDIHKIFYLCCSMRSWYLLLRRQIRAVRREIFDTEVLLECQSVLFSSKRCCMSIYGDLFRSILLACRSTSVCKLESSWEHRANRSDFFPCRCCLVNPQSVKAELGFLNMESMCAQTPLLGFTHSDFQVSHRLFACWQSLSSWRFIGQRPHILCCHVWLRIPLLCPNTSPTQPMAMGQQAQNRDLALLHGNFMTFTVKIISCR